jgi:hypothetical protein
MAKQVKETEIIQISGIAWDPEPADVVGAYANVMQISFNQHEFMLAFGQVVGVDAEQKVQKCKLVSKLVVPHHLVPKIAEAIEGNLTRFTEIYGEPGEPQPTRDSESK